MTNRDPSAPRPLLAGPLECWLVGADLRRLRVGGVEVVQRIYAAVRDHDWSTVPLRVLRQEVAQTAEGFVVVSELASTRPGLEYTARMVHTGGPDGALRVTFDGTAGSAFRRMRIGLCVLHPAALAGGTLRVEHDDDPPGEAILTPDIAPWPPAYGIRALETAGGGAHIRLEFSGEVFEMEDQRNWGDASYKTYGTPSALPRPQAVAAGDTVSQAVALRVLAAPAKVAAAGVALLHVGTVERPRARIGHAQTADHGHVHLALSADEGWAERWRQQLAAAEFTRSRDGLPVLVTVPAEAVTTAMAADLATLLPPDSELLALDQAERSDAAAAHAVLRAALPAEIPVGVGSRVQFTEVNRGTVPPGAALLGFPINPLVHADDDWSLLENTAAFAAIAGSAKRHGVPLRIGPLALPPDDPRITGQVGAAWLVAALAHLLPALDGDDALTLGPAPSFAGSPSAAVLHALAGSSGVLPVGGTGGDVAAFATRTAAGCRVFIANTGHQPAPVLLTGLRHGREALHLSPRTMAIVEG